VAKEAENTTGTGKAYSNGKSRKNKCSGGQKPPVRARKQRRGNEERLLCNGDE